MDISSRPNFGDAERKPTDIGARSELNPPGAVAATRATTNASAVAWAAVFAGAAGAAALSLLLLILGTGLGLSAVSPWAQAGASATAIGISAILWITLTQVFASGIGGYLAGRLRTRWHDTPSDEVYFRDTVHGFLAWAVASLATAALLGSAIGSIVGSGVQAGATVAGTAGAAGAAGSAGALAATRTDASGPTGAGAGAGAGSAGMSYFVDALFRADSRAPSGAEGTANPADPATATSTAASPRSVADPAMAATSAAEVARILMQSGRAETLPLDDLRYVSHLVAQRTGISQFDAERRVNDTYARWQAKLRDADTAARETANTARKAASYTALWMFIALLIGAFVASLAATFGGRQRDA